MKPMMGIWMTVVLVAAWGRLAASAESLEEPTAQHDMHHSQYADQEGSGIAALSQEEKSGLLAGSGMGFARAAELNHYPGPKHILELAQALGLSQEQEGQIEAIHARMLEEAQRLGASIVEKEQHLDRRFANQHIDDSILRSATAEIADLYGELRFVHLRAHLESQEVLAESQIAKYDELRGY